MVSSELREKLAGLGIPELRYFETIGSTNDEAMAWAEKGAPDFALGVADRQTHGRGRLGRHWVTNPGAALAFSVVFRPQPVEMAYVAQFSPLGGLGVASALESLGLAAQIKWPNDVLANRKKLCGILAEAVWSGAELRGLVLGIGVNVAPESVPPAAEVMFPATCVESELGRTVDRLALLRSILREIQAWRRGLGKNEFLAAWEAHLAFRGEMVKVDPPGAAPVLGRLVGVDAQGDLRLRQENGEDVLLAAGDVHLRPEPGETHSTG